MSESTLEAGQLLDILAQSDPSSPFFQQASKILDTHLVVHRANVPEATPPGPPRKFTIGMATYDDFDGVYFSVQAIRLYHPEITADTEILVLDNHPETPAAGALKALDGWVDGYRYVPVSSVQGTAVRDLIFREARGEFVLCMDSHVLFRAGALARLLRYFEQHPDTRDLLQGPIIADNLSKVQTHFDPVWRGGMWGTWALDERGADPAAPEFEIPMQGLGVFACRRDAWPGLNPRLRGFGGEEGYLHEKFRRQGGRTLCLPFLQWLHRFGRPNGTPYPHDWEGRIRNYLILFDELGLDRAPVIQHFSEFLGPERTSAAVDAADQEFASPFHFFDAIYCINLDRQPERWQAAQARFEAIGIAPRVHRFPAIETPWSHHIGCALSHRAIVAEAKWRGLENVLVFEDDVVFSANALEDLRANIEELKQNPWKMFYLGGHRWGRTFEKAPGCQHLEMPVGLTCTHAVAYHRSMFDRILSDIPETPSAVALWLRKHRGIDQYYAFELAGGIGRDRSSGIFVASPSIASQGSILAQETSLFPEQTRT